MNYTNKYNPFTKKFDKVVCEISWSDIKNKPAIESSSSTNTIVVPFYYNSINEQVADYLFDNEANSVNKMMLRIDDLCAGADSLTYMIKKASFFCKDPNADALINPVISIHKNRESIMRRNVTIELTTHPQRATGFDTDLYANINQNKNSLRHDDYIDIFVNIGTGTSNGSLIYGYFIFEYEAV